jgi:hypothetical protein
MPVANTRSRLQAADLADQGSRVFRPGKLSTKLRCSVPHNAACTASVSVDRYCPESRFERAQPGTFTCGATRLNLCTGR